MAAIIFYEKPGCATNARQKLALTAAGHDVTARSLLTEPWTAARLMDFFGTTPVSSWFNPASPRLKSGEIKPAAVDRDSALALMMDDPLLIRRPLVEIGERRCAGFDREPVLSLLANAVPPELQTCSGHGPDPRCPVPKVLPSGAGRS